jgi:hypothetical protein
MTVDLRYKHKPVKRRLDADPQLGKLSAMRLFLTTDLRIVRKSIKYSDRSFEVFTEVKI